MVISQTIIRFNSSKITWLDKKVSDVYPAGDEGLIVAVDSKTGKAGAVNFQGETIIPFESSTLDPWDGAIIRSGMYTEGNLYWVIKNNKITIVNEKNQVVIPEKYGYLKKVREDQFIAGTGELSGSAVNGAYTYKKYGVITEKDEVLIPIEYDSITQEDDKKYIGTIEEDTRTIKRTFYASGNLEKEEIEDKQAETQPDTEEAVKQEEGTQDGSEAEETPEGSIEPEQQEENSQESDAQSGENLSTHEDGNSEIQDYDGPELDYEYVNYYEEGDGVRLHLAKMTCTLEDEEGNVLLTFEGDRVKDTMPVFTNTGQLVVDEGEKTYRVYNAKTGVLLCDLKREADCMITPELLTYDQGTEYIVKNFNNTELFRIAKPEGDRFLNSQKEKARFVFQASYFVYQGDDGRTLVTNKGVVIADQLDSISYNDENRSKENETDQIFICEREGQYGAFTAAGDKILDFAYENIEFLTGHVDALRVMEKRGRSGIVNYQGQIIIPLEYDSVGYGNTIMDADDFSLTQYFLMDVEDAGNHYYGQKGQVIYYLDEEGKKEGEVKYLKEQERSRDLNDFLALGEISENPKLFSVTGNVPIMDNAYSAGGIRYGRSSVEFRRGPNKVIFLLIDEYSERLGFSEYYPGDFTLMGYQHILWYFWMVSSRLFLLTVLLWAAFKIPYDALSDEIYFFRKDIKKKLKKRKGKR